MEKIIKMKTHKGAMRPSIIIVTLVILSAGLYFLFNASTPTIGNAESNSKQKPNRSLPDKNSEDKTLISPNPHLAIGNNTSFDFASLDLTLLAAIVAKPINLSSAIIQSKASAETYNLSDKINQTDVTIAAIYSNYVVLAINNQEYELRLSAAVDTNNKYASYQREDPEQEAHDNKRAKEIGNRPKELEHIIVITPESEGYYVTPGINPDLFRAARFKEGDVLQSINGKDVNIPEELEQAKALIATAETLAFSVLRGGVLITLYLDIPAESLSITE